MSTYVRYYADQADRNYGRTSTQYFPSVNDAVSWARSLRSGDVIEVVNGGVIVLPAYWSLYPAVNLEVVEHSFADEGWSPYVPVPMTADDPQSFAQTVSSGRGVLTSTAAGSGNLRVAYLRTGTHWADGEIRSVICGPTGWSGTNAQQGHIHRVRERLPGLWEGIAIWTSVVFGGDYSYLHVNAVRWDGTTLLQGASTMLGSQDAGSVDRSVRVTGHRRFNFGGWINEYTTVRPDLWGLAIGNIVSVINDPVASFNETDIAIANVDTVSGIVQVFDPVDTSAVSYAAVENGLIRPSGVDSQKRWTPYNLATRVVGGTQDSVPVEIKRWRLGEPEPDWGDTRVRRGTVTTNANVPTVATDAGHCALWGAHMHTGSAATFGDVEFRQDD